MGGYIANFTVYTMAMAGLICFAVFVYKKVMDGSFRSIDTKYLSVEESMSLTPRKTLHIVRAGNEKFLIASDVDRTTLISKLTQPSPKADIETLTKQEQAGIQTQAPQPVYRRVKLEPVKSKAAHIKNGMDRREVITAHTQQPFVQGGSANSAKEHKTIELDFNTPVNHGFSTMKEMAKKINEL